MTHFDTTFCDYRNSSYQISHMEYEFTYEPISDHDPLRYDDYYAVIEEDTDGSGYITEIFTYDTEERQVLLTGERFELMEQWLYQNRGDDIQNHWSANR